MTNEEKRKIVDNLLNPNNFNKRSTCDKINNLLQEDTNNTGILYKYKPINCYTLKSILDNTMYCSNPNDFNDPFDCYLGASFWSLYAEEMNYKYDNEWNIIAYYFKRMVQYNKNQKTKNKMKKFEKQVAQQVKQDEKLWIFLQEFNAIKNTYERQNLLIKNAWSMRRIVELLLQHEECSSKLPFISKHYKIIFGDTIINHDTDEKIDEKEKILEYVKTNNPDKLNTVQNIYEKIETIVTSVNENINNSMRVGCLSATNSSIKMWANYADFHRGICIAYDYSHYDIFTYDNFPLPVIYSHSRPLMPWRSAVENTNSNKNKDNRELAIGLLCKSKVWEEEREWRIIVDSTKDQNVKMPPVKCIYLGAKISKTNKELVIKIAELLKIPVQQMTLHPSQFSVTVKDNA